mgnify:CR=1 FL=1
MKHSKSREIYIAHDQCLYVWYTSGRDKTWKIEWNTGAARAMTFGGAAPVIRKSA